VSQRDLRTKIQSTQNIRKITRAMEMVSAARLRRAEQRIESLRPYAGAIRRMTRQAAEASGKMSSLPVLREHDSENTVGVLMVTADRGLAGAFNAQIVRAGIQAADEYVGDGKQMRYYATGRRGVSSLNFRKREPAGSYVGFTDRPSYSDARKIADDLIAAYVDGEVDRVEIFYNGYISPLTQEVRRETLLPIQQATILEGNERDTEGAEGDSGHHALVEYEPDPEDILKRLVPDYVEISIYRALLESTASEHGARMTAMRSASDNAAELISDYTLQANRARQAEITQEILEVVGGAEAL
jgi:F-type H+-transporting ATPase subunit gamma